jgi:hypothetical protein
MAYVVKPSVVALNVVAPSLNSQLEDKVFYSVVMMDNQIMIFTFVTNIYTGKNHTISIVILVPRTHPLQNIIVFSPLS